MSNKFQELKNLRESKNNFGYQDDPNIIENEQAENYGENYDNIENVDNMENMENLENMENDENLGVNNSQDNYLENPIPNNMDNYEENQNYEDMEYKNMDMNQEEHPGNNIEQNYYDDNYSNTYKNNNLKQDQTKYSNNYNNSEYNRRNHEIQTPRTMKSRIEIDASVQNQTNQNSNEMEENDSKKKNIFITDYHLNSETKDNFTFHDLIIPNTKSSKICIIKDIYNKNLRLTEIADHFQFYEPTPTIVMIGANTIKKVKILAGLTRAALNTKAAIIDSGLFTGMEKFCSRKNIPLIGISPKSKIEMPKISNEKITNNTLSQSHSHFILLGDEAQKLDWGEENKIKLGFAERISTGRKGFSYKCKIVGVLLGNISKCEDEIYYFVEKNLPIILVDDSDLTGIIRKLRKGENIRGVSEKLKLIANYSKLIDIEDNSENLASVVHISLTLTF